MSSFNLNYLLKILSPNTIPVAVKPSTYIFWGDAIQPPTNQSPQKTFKQHHTFGEKVDAFLQRSEQGKDFPSHHITLEILADAIRKEKVYRSGGKKYKCLSLQMI